MSVCPLVHGWLENNVTIDLLCSYITKSLAVAMIADRTDWQCLQGHPRSMIFISSERAYTIFYSWTIATLTSSFAVSKICPLMSQNFRLKIAAKPLQMETWLLLTAYRKSPAPYPMVPSPITYDLPFSHNTARSAYHSALW